MNLNQEQIRFITEYLTSKLDPFLIILFGSAAAGRLRTDSDIDLAFLSTVGAQPYDLFMLSQDMGGKLGRDVHLVDLRHASTVLQCQVVSKGKVILDREPLLRQEFIVQVLKEYARLNEERIPILTKIKQRGSVFG